MPPAAVGRVLKPVYWVAEPPATVFGAKGRTRPVDLGVRHGFYDIAQSLCDGFGLSPWGRGESFLAQALA